MTAPITGAAYSRRRFLGMAGGAGLVLAAGIGVPRLVPALAPPGSTGQLLRSAVPLPAPFQVPLPVPDVLAPVRRDADADHYELVAREATTAVLPGTQTAIWGYDGTFPGPTIEARAGRAVRLRYRNELPVPTVLHLHGGHTPPESDGYPTDLVLPTGRTWPVHHQHDPMARPTVGEREYVYPMRQRAAALWYHDHRMDFTGPAVYRGLAGFCLIRDDVEDALPLPRGDRELPLMIADRAFAADGSFDYPSVDRTLREIPGVTEQYVPGVLGDVILVNGAPWPVHEVAAVKYRLRLLNASNARRYELALDPPPAGAPFVQIGSDGGLLVAPRPHETVVLAPAERYDVVVDFGGYPVGTEVTLHNRLGTGPTSVVMRFRVARRAPDDTAVPDRLAEIEPLDRGQAVRTRDFSLLSGMVGGRHGWVIGGRPFDPAQPVASPRLGDVEIWRFVSDLHHPLHLHLVTMQVLSRAGRPPNPLDAGLKDTVDLTPGEAVEVITRFEGYRGRYVFHCHNLEHEDMGMMATFETV